MTLKAELRCIRFPLILLEMFLQLKSPPVVNYIDLAGFGKAHTCLYKVQQLTVMSEQKPSLEVEGIRRPLRQDCVKAQICVRVQKKTL